MDARILTADIGYKLSDTLSLSAVASWNRVKTSATYDIDFTPARTSFGARRQDTDTVSQELYYTPACITS